MSNKLQQLEKTCLIHVRSQVRLHHEGHEPLISFVIILKLREKLPATVELFQENPVKAHRAMSCKELLLEASSSLTVPTLQYFRPTFGRVLTTFYPH